MTNDPRDTGAGSPLTVEETERMARYLGGELSQEERARWEREILADPRLADALYSDVNLRESIGGAADDVARARHRRDSTAAAGGARWLRIALPAAAVVLVALLVPRYFEKPGSAPSAPAPEGERRLRSASPASPSSDGASAPRVVALFPTGSFDEPPERFLWTKDRLATTYRLEISDESKTIVFSAETPDTTLDFPAADLVGRAGAVLSWHVVPKSGATELQPSTSLQFRVGP
jgi:hypothetical protein